MEPLPEVTEKVVDLKELTKLIFSGQPKPNGSITFSIEEITNQMDLTKQEERNKLQYEVLRDIVMDGINILWGVNSIDLHIITKEQISSINNYMKCINYKVILKRDWLVEEDVETGKKTERLTKFGIGFDSI